MQIKLANFSIGIVFNYTHSTHIHYHIQELHVSVLSIRLVEMKI